MLFIRLISILLLCFFNPRSSLKYKENTPQSIYSWQQKDFLMPLDFQEQLYIFRWLQSPLPGNGCTMDLLKAIEQTSSASACISCNQSWVYTCNISTKYKTHEAVDPCSAGNKGVKSLKLNEIKPHLSCEVCIKYTIKWTHTQFCIWSLGGVWF